MRRESRRAGPGFPFIKTMDQFDFSFQPSIDERLVKELATLRFIANAENVMFLGPPGVGKTHLTISLGLDAIALYGAHEPNGHLLFQELVQELHVGDLPP